MTCYLFDIDNTLTPPRQKMHSHFNWFFLQWMKDKEVYLVGGSDQKKIETQLPASIISHCRGIFSSMGNQFKFEKNLVYTNDWQIPFSLNRDLEKFVESSAYQYKTSNHIEKRIGMVNFSVAGRDSNLEQRQAYNDWDDEHEERKKIVKYIESKYHKVEAKIGGQISIDIFPKGRDKSQASKWIRQNVSEDIVFIGDQCGVGGNDFAIYKDVTINGGRAYEVSGFSETQKILEQNYS